MSIAAGRVVVARGVAADVDGGKGGRGAFLWQKTTHSNAVSWLVGRDSHRDRSS
jgi:hypothetical protein